MGLTAERVAQRFGITRAQCDEFSLRQPSKSARRDAAGKFDDEIVPVPVTFTTPTDRSRRKQKSPSNRTKAPVPTPPLEALGALKPAFHIKGVTTAGNRRRCPTVRPPPSSCPPIAQKPSGSSRSRVTSLSPPPGYKPEEMGLGPVFAIPKALKLAGLTLDQIDVIELNEAFAAQSLAVIQEANSILRK